MAERRNPWREVQAAHPGANFIRVINLADDTQAFVEPDPDRIFPPAGATVYMPSAAPGIDIAEARDLSRYFNEQPYAVRLRPTAPEPTT